MHGVEAHAQSATKPVVAHIAGGYAEAVGVSADQFDSGWSVYGGATFHPDPAVPVGIRVDLGYSYFSAIHQVVDSETPALVHRPAPCSMLGECSGSSSTRMGAR
jgi:hypothetical protein